MLPALALAALLVAPTTRPAEHPEAARVLAVAATPGLTADEIETAVNAIDFPSWDEGRADEPGYEQEHAADLAAVRVASAALRLRFVDDYPDDPRADDFLSHAALNRGYFAVPTQDDAGYLATARTTVADLRRTSAGPTAVGRTSTRCCGRSSCGSKCTTAD